MCPRIAERGKAVIRRGLTLACFLVGVVLLSIGPAAALPVQYHSVDLFDQAQARLDGLSSSQAGGSLAVVPGIGTASHDAIAVGMPDGGPAGRAGAGAVAVLRGAVRLHGTIDLSTLTGRNGFAVFGAQAGDHAGFSLAAVPRSHKTPLLAIGCPYATRGGSPYTGVIYLIDPARVHTSSLDLARPGRALVATIIGPAGGEAGYALAGGALSPRGGDLLVGAPATAGPNGSYAGAAYLIFGPHRPRTIDLSRPRRAAATVLGPGPDAGLGTAVAITPAADGRLRMWIGAPTASPLARALAGEVFGLARLVAGATVNTARTGVATIEGASAGDGLGNAIAVLAPAPWRPGAMLALGASGASPRSRQSAGEVVLSALSRLRGTIDLARPRVPVTTIAGAAPNDGAGYSLAAVRDPVTGIAALAIGAPFVNSSSAGGDPPDAENVGAAYVLGGARVLPTDLGRVGSAGVTITGARANDQAGTALAGGWLSGAHLAHDLVIGAPFALTASEGVGGAAYLVAGVAGR